MAPEYHFDYHTAHPNRFAKGMGDSPTVMVMDEDVAKIFSTPEAVNKALRALIEAMPAKGKPRATLQEKRSLSAGNYARKPVYENPSEHPLSNHA